MMAIQKIDNRIKYCSQYWELLYLKINQLPIDSDIEEINQQIGRQIICTNYKKFVYSCKTPGESYQMVREHNNNLTKIKQQCTMPLNWMVKHYGLRKLSELKVGINYNYNRDYKGKYIISFKSHDIEATHFTFKDPEELEDKIKQYCNQQKLINLLINNQKEIN